MSDEGLAGKHIVVTAGRPREDIDGVRHYANHSRPEGQGYATAAWLAAQGAHVTVISPRTALVPPPDCRIVHERASGAPLLSGRDIMEETESYIVQNPCDAVLCFASLASIRPKERAANKLKIKSAETSVVSMTVTGNVDVEARAQKWGVPVVGYDGWQEKFSVFEIPPWLNVELRSLFSVLAEDYPVSPLQEADEDFPADLPQILNGKKVILTSGRTEEQITTTGDIITNFSSGRQGYELACAFALSGAKVVFVSGPSLYSPSSGGNVQVVRVREAKSMLAACNDFLPADVFVGVAAVADFGCVQPFFLRLAEDQSYDLVLDRNPDILTAMGQHPSLRPSVVVGFAAETDAKKILFYAKEKLVVKNADIICANLVGAATDKKEGDNQIMFVTRGGGERLCPVMSKRQAAATIVREVAGRFISTAK
ncbi:MAG: phosphopantothenoylcysteine decarboxylase [Bdellovibrionales bacterium]